MQTLNRLTEVIKPYVMTVLVMSFVVSIVFIWIHKAGFTKFIQDPAFFDGVNIERSYQIKK